MRRSSINTALLILVALACAAGARAQGGARRDVPPDRITLEEFKSLLAEGKVVVLDVRYGVERKIKGATHIQLDQLETRLAELPRDREIVTYCS
jgi:predicted metal-binding protein